EGDVALHAAEVEGREKLGQFLDGEVARARAGVELLDSEVDRVGAVLDGGADAVEVARGGEHLRPGARGRGRRVARRGSRSHGAMIGKGTRGRNPYGPREYRISSRPSPLTSPTPGANQKSFPSGAGPNRTRAHPENRPAATVTSSIASRRHSMSPTVQHVPA